MYKLLLLAILVGTFYSCKEKRQPVAVIDGSEIDLSDVDQLIDKQLFQFVEGIYILRKETLENMVREKVIAAEAQNIGLTPAQLLNKMVYSKLTDSILEQKAKELNWVISDRSNPFKAYDIKSTFGKAYFKESLALFNKRKYADSLMEKHNIKIMLSPPDKVRPTVDLSSVDVHFEGNLESGNSVVLIGNPDCDGCRQLKPITDSLYKKYSGIIKFGFVYFDNIVTLSSLALEGAIRQHKFIEMSDLLYKYPMQPDTLSLLKLAKDIKLDTAKLHMFITASEPTTSIQKNIARLQDKGIYTTPVLIINNKMFSAPFNFDEIDAYLTKLID